MGFDKQVLKLIPKWGLKFIRSFFRISSKSINTFGHHGDSHTKIGALKGRMIEVKTG